MVVRSQGRTYLYILRPRGKSPLTRIFGPKKNKTSEVWRKLHNDELHDLYPLLDFIKVIKLRR